MSHIAAVEDGGMVRPVINREIAFAGRQVKQKITLGLTLALIIPMLVLTYGFYTYVLPLTLSVKGGTDLTSVLALVTFTALVMLGGGVVVWDVATAVSRAARLITSSQRIDPTLVPNRRDDIGALLASFARMTATIEQQAEELRRVPARLDELARQAFRDPLTHLANRALFMDRLGHALVRAERRADYLAVLVLDLDRFKVVNDSLGHAIGDQILIEAGRRVKSCVRPEDTVARLGGDEFGIMLEALTGIAGATHVAEQILSRFQDAFVVDGREVFITSSIGIAISPSSRTEADQLLHDADLAMYQAKASGKGHYAVHDGSTNAPSLELLNLEMDLRAAVPRSEFTLHYQPVVELETNQIVALEALVRWVHPHRGLLLPADFIRLSEITDLIVPIGRWVLGEACRQAREWARVVPADVPLVIAVNLSVNQVREEHLLTHVMEVLRTSGMSPNQLMLEITETSLMEDQPTMLDKLEALRRAGVRLALDDFGMGYSFLRYLRRSPVDTLKIDQAFIGGITERSKDSGIVQTVIDMAKKLNLRVVAEGIETEQQAEQLRAMGCDYGQGFFFSRPMPPEHIPALLRSSRWSGRMTSRKRAQLLPT
jgi:diguanylate cyclase (GGDEF)-like protein